MKTIVNLYFEYWNNHSTPDLRKLFDNEIVLEDWENTFSGIEDVIQENENIFTNFPKVNATISDLALSEKSVFAKIKVILNEENTIDVIDIFEFKDNKIIKIKAFKG